MENLKILEDELDRTSAIDDLDLDDLKAFVCRSNWERYFDEKIVSYPAEKLTQQWERLYELRCKIAHNRSFNKVDFDDIVKIAEELRDVLQKATYDLYNVYVPEEEREVVAESLASNINELYGEFITSWKKLENTLRQKAHQANLDIEKNRRGWISFRQIIQLLYQRQIITKKQYSTGIKLYRVRNSLVHQQDIVYGEDEVRYFTHMIFEYLHVVTQALDKYEKEIFEDTSETGNSMEKDEQREDQEEHGDDS